MEVIRLPFVKMQGAGNDYVYMDSIADIPFKNLPEKYYQQLAKKISDRHYGIGSDGLILILPSANADFYMRVFNADGSEAQMCGNGIRCVAKYVFERNLTDKKVLRIETPAGIKVINLKVSNGRVENIRVDMGSPLLEPGEIPVRGELESKFFSSTIKVGKKEFEFTAIGMGNPHCVVFVDELSDRLIYEIGPLIENDPLFPERTNVEFVKILTPDKIKMRVWERGSGETLACGTGACASAVASFLNGYTERKVEVNLLGGNLLIDYDRKDNHVYMTGGAEFIAEGEYFFNKD